MGGLLGGGGNGGGGLLSGVTDTLNDTTKGLPVVGGITEPLLGTVGSVTDELPIVGGTGGKKELCPSAAAPSSGSGPGPRSGRPSEEGKIARDEEATAGTRDGRNGNGRQVGCPRGRSGR